MPKSATSLRKVPSTSPLPMQALAFFRRLTGDAPGRKLLSELDHSIEFDLTDGKPFYVTIKRGNLAVHEGLIKPRRFDVNDVIHFRLQSSTIVRLLEGKIRFTDALVPTAEDGKDAMYLGECTLFKWSVLSWVGRMFRGAQVRSTAK